MSASPPGGDYGSPTGAGGQHSPDYDQMSAVGGGGAGASQYSPRSSNQEPANEAKPTANIKHMPQPGGSAVSSASQQLDSIAAAANAAAAAGDWSLDFQRQSGAVSGPFSAAWPPTTTVAQQALNLPPYRMKIFLFIP